MRKLMLDAGAAGYVSKDGNLDLLINTIREAVAE